MTVKQILTERNVLAQVDSPYVVKMYRAFETAKKLIFVLEYAPGRDLYH